MSIVDLLKEKAGVLECLVNNIVEQWFPTFKLIVDIKCPLLVIHGDKDPLIPSLHGEKICRLSASEKKHFNLREGCTHKNYDRETDISIPIFEFMKTFKIGSSMSYYSKKDNQGIDGLPSVETADEQSLFHDFHQLRL